MLTHRVWGLLIFLAVMFVVVQSIFTLARPLMDWIESRGATLSEPLSAVVQLLNPQTIVLGGNFPNPVLSALRQHIDLSVYDVPTRMPLSKPDIVISDVLGEASRATASAILPLAKYLSYLD